MAGLPRRAEEGVADCAFCDIGWHRAPAKIVAETDESVAFFPLEPAALGHTLVIPKVHIPDLWALTPDAAGHVGKMTIEVARALRSVLEPDGMNVINSAGEAASQTVFHLHVHLVPRWFDDHIGDIWPPGEPWADQSKDELADLVREAWFGE